MAIIHIVYAKLLSTIFFAKICECSNARRVQEHEENKWWENQAGCKQPQFYYTHLEEKISQTLKLIPKRPLDFANQLLSLTLTYLLYCTDLLWYEGLYHGISGALTLPPNKLFE